MKNTLYQNEQKLFSTSKCKCERGRVVSLKNITRHRKQAPHLNYVEKNKN